ncbi:NAD-dependent epimerase/dehydratase family protein [Salinicola sp. LHM]|uniref:NAD-dependent epimerase/dehydratase family protein n=1 Tax=Salinicola sp. LHM TaxID=3065298 RepID=UPI002ACD4DBB|nr:NAD-dependent epimerase/dehydratase family protein [Salinicola sp. LHM]MED5501940.1 NAD-dependent epimerase/dehydratase family protein [Pseudomonadota bacterium]WQH32154.1 NAD-dependent epimerase/dehydratase family protein [Salinicola sp. LHM]
MATSVALTGATGFIGRRLIAGLVRDGVQVRALTRSAPATQRDSQVEWIRGSLDDATALDQLVDGVEAVIHCAGAVRGANEATFRRINVDGSRRLFEATQRQGCARLLLMSSLAARHPELSWYATSKYEAEQRLASSAQPVVTVFRPTAVYGPGDRELRPLFETLMRGWLLMTGPSETRLSFLHVDDLVAAAKTWLHHSPSGARVDGSFELHDGYPGGYTWTRIAEIGAGVRGAPVRRLPIPAGMLRALAQANLMLARGLNRSPMLTPEKLRELRHHDWTCDNSALTRAIGWTPQITLEQALGDRRQWAVD